METCDFCGAEDFLNSYRECRYCCDAADARPEGRSDAALDTPSLSDYRNDAGEWMASPEQIRADMNWQPDPADWYDDY